MWSVGQWDVESSQGAYVFIWNGTIHLITFVLIFGMIALVRKKGIQIEEKSRELARSNSELEQFAYKAAHDLRSPLTTIFGFTELLTEKYQNSGDEETKECTDGILRGTQRMNAMIKALLSYATVMKKEEKAPSADLEKVVAETLENLHAEIVEKNAEITHTTLPVLAIQPGLAGLLFQNLIGNALKYCETQPRIRVSAVHQGKEWLFSIQDNGIGIPEESRERIFIMFEKLPAKHQYPGSGIGLATCQKIVERYGGRIWVESPPKDGSVQSSVAEKSGEGSTFFFTLPALRVEKNK